MQTTPNDKVRTRDPPLHEAILQHCSPGPWQHGVRLPPFSGDVQPCVFGREHELPLAMLDDTDANAAANVVLMAAVWALCNQLGALLQAVWESEDGTATATVREECGRTSNLFVAIHDDVDRSIAEQCGGDDCRHPLV